MNKEPNKSFQLTAYASAEFKRYVKDSLSLFFKVSVND